LLENKVCATVSVVLAVALPLYFSYSYWLLMFFNLNTKEPRLGAGQHHPAFGKRSARIPYYESVQEAIGDKGK
jgi:hypothetical protein